MESQNNMTTENTEVYSQRENEENGKWIESDLSSRIIGCALKVHTGLGPGLLESAYEECLFYELTKAGLHVRKQVPMPLIYSEVKMDIGYRVDLLIENKIIVEIKAVETFNDVHLAQVLTYLKLSGCKLGLLMNFNVSKLKNGIKRLVL
ncbi:GxxExxY protein [soil metagenome]